MPHVEPAGADQTHVIRALVVDDSAVLRRLISNVLASDPEIEVVGTAVDGLDAIEKADVLRPDVVTLDEARPMQRLVLRACSEGRDPAGLAINARLEVEAAGDAVDVVRVAAYFETGERIEIVEGLAPFSDFVSVFPSEGSCSEGIALVVERLDSELSIPGTVAVSIDAEACEGNPLEELSLDVELAE